MSNKRMGSGVDDFLKEEGTFEKADARSVKEVVAWQVAEAMRAALLATSRSVDGPERPD
jgi:antitoxin HicB